MILLLLKRWWPGLAAGSLLLFLAAAALHYRASYGAEKALRLADRGAYVAAQAAASRAAQDALVRQEATYKEKAREADHEYALAAADVQSAADRYIAAHRVRPQAADRTPSGASAGPASGGAGVREDLPSEAVMVSTGDVRACAVDYDYAVKLRAWALGL